MAWDDRHLEVGVLLLLLDQRFDIDAELRVQCLRIRRQDVVVKATLLHDSSAGLHGDPHAEVHAQDLTEERASHDVRLHRDQRVLHREASLTALSMGLLVEEAAMVLVRMLRPLCSER